MKKEDLILEFLKKNSLSFIELKNKLSQNNIKIKNKDLDSVLLQMKRDNKIYFKRRDEKYYLKDEESIVGIFKETRYGYGFVELDDQKTVFIPEKFTNTALSNDTVKIIFFSKREGDDPEKRSGKIVRIVKRNGNNIIIRVKKNKDDNVVYLPDEESRFKYDLFEKKSFPEGTILVVKFKDIHEKVVYVEIKKVLGNEEDASIDYLVLAYKNNIHLKFSNESIKEAREIQIDPKEKREDYRNLLTYTIDGISSKDLDDAVSVVKNDKGFTLYVHIADVSNFVREKSALDYEAFQSCNSIYLIDKVFPMLPEVLSNELCSLNPNVDRLTLTCKMFIDRNGKVTSYQVDNSIINSNYRLTYEEVDIFLKDSDKNLRDNKEISESILIAKELADLIRKEKVKNGMIDFSLPETKIDLDEKGEPIKIWNKFQSASEKIIEDLMVVTNQTIANFLLKNHVEGIFRIHEKPKETNLIQFFNLLRTFVSTPADSYTHITQQWFMKFLDVIKGEDYELILKRNMVQSMEKAIYSENNIGHYALGINEYLHFTSPIRRYADLIVHRNIKKYIKDESYFKDKKFNDLENISLECSKKERDAASIERKLKDIKKIRYIQKNKKDSYEGIIVSFTKLGMFIEVDNLIQGIVRFISFGEDAETFYDEANYLVSIKKGSSEKRYRLGEKVNVKIENLNIVKGQIDFLII